MPLCLCNRLNRYMSMGSSHTEHTDTHGVNAYCSSLISWYELCYCSYINANSKHTAGLGDASCTERNFCDIASVLVARIDADTHHQRFIRHLYKCAVHDCRRTSLLGSCDLVHYSAPFFCHVYNWWWQHIVKDMWITEQYNMCEILETVGGNRCLRKTAWCTRAMSRETRLYISHVILCDPMCKLFRVSQINDLARISRQNHLW